MPLTREELTRQLDPAKTILFFGAGASIPSGMPSAEALKAKLCERFGYEADDLDLAEAASLVEIKHSRTDLIQALRQILEPHKPTGGLLNLPDYEWASIFTTNYDTLIEQTYKAKKKPISVLSSNFDFSKGSNSATSVTLYKLHGTIDVDVCDGHSTRMIVSQADYDQTEQYRQNLYDTLKYQLIHNDLVIIGYSLSDSHIKQLIDRAIAVRTESRGAKRITLLVYKRDENRAALYESRDIQVCFAGIDEFFGALANIAPASQLALNLSGHPFDVAPRLHPLTVDVRHSLTSDAPAVSDMYNGWPAKYGDIRFGLTFKRTAARQIQEDFAQGSLVATVLGACGVGKTTLARQVLVELADAAPQETCFCWEHKSNSELITSDWKKTAANLAETMRVGYLLIDDAHHVLREVNDLLNWLSAESIASLKLILTTQKNQWAPRIKSPTVFTKGKVFEVSKLDETEINNLLNIVDHKPELRQLVENSFSGFSPSERRRRLKVRCESDMFVCLKNIFASEKIDDILLREFASLDEGLQEIYRLIAAMESSGINVHRQLALRILNIDSGSIDRVLQLLSDIVHEYTVNAKDGIFGWKGRHLVIMEIITKYKFASQGDFFTLFDRVIDNIVPSYEIERQTIRQLCNFESGLERLSDRSKRNILLRKMISVTPGERIPRHRLIRNLIEMGEFEKADTEIKIFENDFGADATVHRYKIVLLISRAEHTSGILQEDRLAILEEAHSKMRWGLKTYTPNKYMLRVYGDLGLSFFKLMGDYTVLDAAIEKMRESEPILGDPDVTKMIAAYQNQLQSNGTK